MRILYIADDGTEFDNEFDCEVYEETNRHNTAYNIEVYDLDGNRLTLTKDLSDEDFYWKAEKVVLHTKEEVDDLQWLAEYTGWCEFEQLTSVGTWVRREENGEGIWEKVNE